MKKQAIVVGLGQFGMALARSMTELGVEILGIDRRADLVRAASIFAAEALTMDATDEAALAQLAPERKDMCVCAIGNEAREASIICTALLRQMGAKRIAARAVDPLHARILHLVGAHDVVNPEEAFGERFATRLVYQRVLEELPLGGDLVITEVAVPAALIGRPLASLQLPRKHGITVVAVKRSKGEGVELPSPTTELSEGDVLILVARPGAVTRMLERI